MRMSFLRMKQIGEVAGATPASAPPQAGSFYTRHAKNTLDHRRRDADTAHPNQNTDKLLSET
jgi:hypothetical protein